MADCSAESCVEADGECTVLMIPLHFTPPYSASHFCILLSLLHTVLVRTLCTSSDKSQQGISRYAFNPILCRPLCTFSTFSRCLMWPGSPTCSSLWTSNHGCWYVQYVHDIVYADDCKRRLSRDGELVLTHLLSFTVVQTLLHFLINVLVL